MPASFLKVLITVFIAEMGDKTQLMLIGLAHKYTLRDIITGTAAAIRASPAAKKAILRYG